MSFPSSIVFLTLVMPLLFFGISFGFKVLIKFFSFKIKPVDKSTRSKMILETFQVGPELYVINLTFIWSIFLFFYYQSLLSRDKIFQIIILLVIFLPLSVIFCVIKGLLLERPKAQIVFSDLTGLVLLGASTFIIHHLLLK